MKKNMTPKEKVQPAPANVREVDVKELEAANGTAFLPVCRDCACTGTA